MCKKHKSEPTVKNPASIIDQNRHTRHVSIRMPIELWAAVVHHAKQQRRTPSNLLLAWLWSASGLTDR